MNQHQVKWKYNPPDPESDAWWQRNHGFHAGVCEECNQEVGGAISTKQGKLSKDNKRAAWFHMQAQDMAAVEDVPMQLVGKIIKQRVTNEVWIISAYGEMPEAIAKRINTVYNSQDYLKSLPWILAVKRSTGWSRWLSGRYTYLEQAYASGLEILKEAYVDGHEIEIASKIDMDTVHVPLGAVEAYLTDLVDEAQSTDKPKDLVALQVRLKKARGMLELLEAAQELVEHKLVGDTE